MFTEFLQIFKGFNFSVDEFNTIMSKMEIKEYKKNDILLRAGAACDNIYLIKSGLVRGYITYEEGAEKTLFVHTAGRFITDYKAFITRGPVSIPIEVLQDSVFISLSYDNMQYLYKTIPQFSNFSRVITEQYLVKLLDEITIHQVIKSPLQRYDAFRQLHLEVIDQIPQHMIADMINISPVHLSRIKSSYSKTTIAQK
jgi:signal-transduction protein with cAMP-binding, CBS, and nucleotidyltransferase domain